MKNSDSLALVAHDLRVALGLALFVEFSFAVALLAVAGAFNDGRPTTTPLFAQAYLGASLFINIGVTLRIWQMLKAAQRGDRAWLERANFRALSLMALIFSAILPSIYINEAAAALAMTGL